MTSQDLLVTPLFVLIILGTAYLFRSRFTNQDTRRYFMPALLVRLFGAIAVGFIYQFYYSGGDTFNYHTHGSLHIWRAMMEHPEQGIQLLLASGGDYYEAFDYSSSIWYYRDPASYVIVKIAAVFDLFTFGTYSSTACLFAVLSFMGAWALFTTFYHKYPRLHIYLALSILFVPSVFFWGSGIFKDTVSLAMIGLLIYSTDKIFLRNKPNIFQILLFFISSILIYKIKIYQLLVILPALILWLFFSKVGQIRNSALRYMATPVILLTTVVMGFVGIREVGRDHPRYSLDRIAETARITAYDIRYGWGARDGIGSGYDIGVPDGTMAGLLRIAPAAINVTLFRPYLFEVKNPLMLFASLESTFVLFLTLFVSYKLLRYRKFKELFSNPDIIFCLVFCLVFAFAVGASTFNFGTLSRYKLPVLPVYLTCLSILYYSIGKVKTD